MNLGILQVVCKARLATGDPLSTTVYEQSTLYHVSHMLWYTVWYAAGQGCYGALKCAARLTYNSSKPVGHVLLSLSR